MTGARSVLFLALALAAPTVACSGPEARAPVDVRVRNASDVVMDDVVVDFPAAGHAESLSAPADAASGEVSYGTVRPAEATAYRSIARAYPYAPVSLRVDGEEHRLQPDDFVGEELLEGDRRYTYELDFEGGTLLGIRLIRD